MTDDYEEPITIRLDYVRAGYLPEWDLLVDGCEYPPSFEVFSHMIFSFPNQGPRLLAQKIVSAYKPVPQDWDA